MKINTNVIGNYNIHRTTNAKPANNVAKAEFNIVSDQITSDEKQFFAKMYPEKSNEITDYHYYGNNGKMSGVSVGSLFDRRG